MSNNKTTCKKTQGEETRALLVRTGTRLFAQNGYHGVSMRTLAAEAGVNLSTVGYHFGSKAGLYEAIIEDIISIRDDFFPTATEVEQRLSGLTDPHALGEGVDWYMRRLVDGIWGMEEHVWRAFLVSRELAQPSDIYPKLEKDFFAPSSDSLEALVRAVVPQGTDREDVHITAHCIIAMVVKLLDNQSRLCKRLGWVSYDDHGREKIIAVLGKRTRGLLGLPMEKK